MNIGIYEGATSLNGLEKWQQAISSNIAASSVAGYKKTEVVFEGVPRGQLNATTGSGFAERLNGSMLKVRSQTRFSQGELKKTGVPTNLAISGEGYFELEMPDRSTLYTRDGQFRLDADSVLVSKQGYPVRGDSGRIQLLPGGGELVIDKRGQVFQGSTLTGKLAITEFANPAVLGRASGGFRVDEKISAGPRRIDEPTVLQGFLEGSNVSSIREMVDLILVSRAYEMNQKVISSIDRRLEQVVRQLGRAR